MEWKEWVLCVLIIVIGGIGIFGTVQMAIFADMVNRNVPHLEESLEEIVALQAQPMHCFDGCWYAERIVMGEGLLNPTYVYEHCSESCIKGHVPKEYINTSLDSLIFHEPDIPNVISFTRIPVHGGDSGEITVGMWNTTYNITVIMEYDELRAHAFGMIPTPHTLTESYFITLGPKTYVAGIDCDDPAYCIIDNTYDRDFSTISWNSVEYPRIITVVTQVR